jgi:hypothetical protein
MALERIIVNAGRDIEYYNAGVPTDGTAGTGAGECNTGAFYTDTSTGDQYINCGTKLTPAWKRVITGVRKINLAAASASLTAQQCGQKFVGAADAIFTLPAIASCPTGTWYEVEGSGTGGAAGVKVTPQTGEAIGGAGLTSTVSQSAINTQGTEAVGDMIRFYNNGTQRIVDAKIGTWAKA